MLAATTHLERTAAWARRGAGGGLREPTAGLLVAQFDHHTSLSADPQLHTHSFVFNLAPRRDGSWGAIISRELYKAQKDAGAVYAPLLKEFVNLYEKTKGIHKRLNGGRVSGHTG